MQCFLMNLSILYLFHLLSSWKRDFRGATPRRMILTMIKYERA